MVTYMPSEALPAIAEMSFYLRLQAHEFSRKTFSADRKIRLMIATVIDEINIQFFSQRSTQRNLYRQRSHLRNQQRLRRFFQRFMHRSCNAFTVLFLIVDNRDSFGLITEVM